MENGVAKKIVVAYNSIIVQITDELKKFDYWRPNPYPCSTKQATHNFIAATRSLATWAGQSALTTTAELQGLAGCNQFLYKTVT